MDAKKRALQKLAEHTTSPYEKTGLGVFAKPIGKRRKFATEPFSSEDELYATKDNNAAQIRIGDNFQAIIPQLLENSEYREDKLQYPLILQSMNIESNLQ